MIIINDDAAIVIWSLANTIINIIIIFTTDNYYFHTAS